MQSFTAWVGILTEQLAGYLLKCSGIKSKRLPLRTQLSIWYYCNRYDRQDASIYRTSEIIERESLMNEFEKQRLFISYSHQDKDEPNEFEKHLAPLVNNGLIVNWSDRKIISGKNFQTKIDKHLADADIICLLISSNFLSSDACMKEKSDAINLMTKKGISVIPIILSECGWKEDMDIRPLLALPTDAQPISSFNRSDTAWQNVYEGLKLVIQDNLTIRPTENLK